jgi:aryl-alcohol dehydrogenase-like predicted oxidoreductase
VSEQSLYNLKDRMIELEVLPACQHYGVGIIPWSPLAGGLLGGVLAKEGSRRLNDRTQETVNKLRPQIERYENFCKEMGESPADVALAWLLHQPGVTAPIIGPRTMAQFEGNLHSIEIKLSEDQLNTLDEIWPGPGGPAPEAYAW